MPWTRIGGKPTLKQSRKSATDDEMIRGLLQARDALLREQRLAEGEHFDRKVLVARAMRHCAVAQSVYLAFVGRLDNDVRRTMRLPPRAQKHTR